MRGRRRAQHLMLEDAPHGLPCGRHFIRSGTEQPPLRVRQPFQGAIGAVPRQRHVREQRVDERSEPGTTRHPLFHA